MFTNSVAPLDVSGNEASCLIRRNLDDCSASSVLTEKTVIESIIAALFVLDKTELRTSPLKSSLGPRKAVPKR